MMLRERGARKEGLAMAAKLTAMLQGKVQMRQMRHQVAEWACQLAPRSAHPLLMRGEVRTLSRAPREPAPAPGRCLSCVSLWKAGMRDDALRSTRCM